MAMLRPHGLDVVLPTDAKGEQKGRVCPFGATCKLRRDGVATKASVGVFGKGSVATRSHMVHGQRGHQIAHAVSDRHVLTHVFQHRPKVV